MPTNLTRVTLTGEIESSSLTVTSSETVVGKIHSISIDYPSNSVEVEVGTDEAVNQTILDLSASSTSKVLYPRTPVQNNSGTDVTYDGTHKVRGKYAVFGRMKLTCANGTDGDTVKVNVLVEEF